jgi:hypothetical protein
MSDSPSHRAVEKRTKKSQDVGGYSAQAKKLHVQKVTLYVPPPVPSDEEDEELGFQVHSPIEDPSSCKTQVNYLREDSQVIINQRNILCYESVKESSYPCFLSLFHADWYRLVYVRKQILVVPMQWTVWAFLKKHKKDCLDFKYVIDMCEYHGLKKIMDF